ncbi:flagellar basal-body MS-ring/collar protein FliF [Pseudooctadecabacter jejudonensis]|uniref:Flagellar M-ring protein n=1 Tax=Pseudooctadecabacter jejudonensis TaxID=1391910 RepID=A0A1Y5S3Z1_9RHOB|nr:flagellar basal-body MS-ring/collar protein FliF [Pseudooctadecabacter jejudonensis]SLN32115.1 Flagellar M-ring protein [Pseudooctadecabacter jejudonensis]
MSNLNTVWSNLDLGRKIMVIGATIAMFAAVLFLARSTPRTDMALLYAGLDSGTAGDVVTSLDQSGVPYDIRGGSIFVPTAERDRLRMTLASEGLPANSSQGYELLDTLSGFGTTSQMFDAAYWRAKEGELARTMLASPHIRAARVHISANSAQPFRREQKPTAAVNVTTVNGGLDLAQADALRFLVASAVPGLAPGDVAVIDGVAGLISGADTGAGSTDATERTSEIRSRVERLLAARVGQGNAVVEVSVETVTETESIIERRFDPETRVAISTEVQESTASAQGSANGDVTVASNLPDGDAAAGAGTQANENSESRTITNFEVSEVQREVMRTPGAIKRVSVAVLVNDVPTTADDGSITMVPRSDAELEDLRVLVASAVGFDETRGDEITIRSMAFEALPELGTEVTDSTPPSQPWDMMALIQSGVLALVALILGLFVVRPILMSSKPAPLMLDSSGQAVTPTQNGLDGSIIEGVSQPTEAISTNGLQNAVPGAPEDPVGRLRDLIDGRRDEAIQVLQSWIDDPKSEGAK